MNCKPGDLAVVVRGKQSGLLVNVVREWRYGDNGHYVLDPVEWGGQFPWLCKSLGEPMTYGGKLKLAEGPVPDSMLRPLRDPSDAAQDETLYWRPVPSKELEQA